MAIFTATIVLGEGSTYAALKHCLQSVLKTLIHAKELESGNVAYSTDSDGIVFTFTPTPGTDANTTELQEVLSRRFNIKEFKVFSTQTTEVFG